MVNRLKEIDYSFATQRVKQLGNSIYVDGKKILLYKGGRIFQFGPLKTTLKTNELLLDRDQYIVKITDMEDVATMGYFVFSRPITKEDIPSFTGQKKIHYLSKITPGAKPTSTSEPMYVEHDVISKRIRLVSRTAGPLGKGSWIRIFRERKQIDIDYKNILSDLFTFDGEQKTDIPIEINIPEIAIGISDDGKLICLPIDRDEPTIGCVGIKRSGKSFGLHGIADRAYHKINKNVAILNDSRNECMSFALPWIYESQVWSLDSSKIPPFAKSLLKIGETTRPLPCVFLSPTSDTLDKLPLEDSGVSFRMSFPFKHLMMNYNYYLKDRKDLRVTNTGRYLRSMAPDIARCDSIDEVEELVDSSLSPDGEPLDRNIKNKILSIMIDLFNYNFLDVTSKVPSKWNVKLKNGFSGEYNPIVSCILAGLVPVLQTADLQTKDGYMREYYKYIITDIFLKQKRDPHFISNNLQIWLFIDELQEIVSSTSTIVDKAIYERCATEGGPSRIGLVYATQNYSYIPHRIKSNTKYLIAFRQGDKKEADAIGDVFNLGKHQKKKLLALKTFEALFLTSEKYILYDSDGRREETDINEVIKGRILPPLSMHKAPRALEAST